MNKILNIPKISSLFGPKATCSIGCVKGKHEYHTKSSHGPKSIIILAFSTAALVQAETQTGNCQALARTAKTIADLRDMGVPRQAILEYVKRVIKDENTLAFTIVAVQLVYKIEPWANDSGVKFKREVLKSCLRR